MAVNVADQRIGRFGSKNRFRRGTDIFDPDFFYFGNSFLNRNRTIEQQQLPRQFSDTAEELSSDIKIADLTCALARFSSASPTGAAAIF